MVISMVYVSFTKCFIIYPKRSQRCFCSENFRISFFSFFRILHLEWRLSLVRFELNVKVKCFIYLIWKFSDFVFGFQNNICNKRFLKLNSHPDSYRDPTPNSQLPTFFCQNAIFFSLEQLLTKCLNKMYFPLWNT